MKFLETVAQQLYSEYGEKLSNSLFIFPNRRSTLFFKRSLSHQIESPIFLPPIYTLKEQIIELSQLREADRVELLFELYLAYCKVTPQADPFDQFFYWGEIILNDFDTLDRYLVNPQQLFINIKDLKEIESDYSFLTERQQEAVKSFWEGFLPERDSENKGQFREAWQLLLPLYNQFNSALLAKGCGYEGALYRRVAEEEEFIKQYDKYDKIFFVGFNELTESQYRIMEQLNRTGKALFYWDYDSPLVQDREGNASLYLKENLARLSSSKQSLSNSKAAEIKDITPPTIEVIAASSNVMQAKIVGKLLEGCSDEEESAVVLPDESLLMPLLNSIPENIDSINITMGYPISSTPLISFIKKVVELEFHSKGFYFKRAIPILNHTFVRRVVGKDAILLVREINKKSYHFIPPTLYSDNHFFSLLFRDPSEGSNPSQELCNKMLSILDFLLESGEVTKIEREFIFHVRAHIERIKGLLIDISLKSFSKVLMMTLSSISVPFSGEPLAGLQIMGLLETRSLDFKNVIICSVNEGMLPKDRSSNSFIPYNIRRGFGLPVRETDDALYSYLFYRLLHRAKKVTLIYNSEGDGVKSAERSRYILQLKYLHKMVSRESSVSYRVEESVDEELLKPIEKSEETIAYMRKKYSIEGSGGLSASALNNYLDCPRRFYFSEIRGLEEVEELEEGIEASHFGSIFHSVMERLYAPYKNSIVTEDLLATKLKDREGILKLVEDAFREIKNIDSIDGYFLLIRDLIVKYIEIALKYDISVAPFHLIELEERIKGGLTLNDGSVVATKGFIDRRDEIEGRQLRVIDYKTGKADLNFKGAEREIDRLFDKSYTRRSAPTFQMFFYAHLLNRDQPIRASIYSLRALVQGSESSIEIGRANLDYFNSKLLELIEEIFDMNRPFIRTDIENRCTWCPFKPLCY